MAWYLSLLQVTAAIVTCGGLCPGLNDVIQNIVTTLADYGVPEDQILGIRYGLRGFYERDDKPVTLTRKSVDGIHLKGGTILVSVECSLGGCRGWGRQKFCLTGQQSAAVRRMCWVSCISCCPILVWVVCEVLHSQGCVDFWTTL